MKIVVTVVVVVVVVDSYSSYSLSSLLDVPRRHVVVVVVVVVAARADDIHSMHDEFVPSDILSRARLLVAVVVEFDSLTSWFGMFS